MTYPMPVVCRAFLDDPAHPGPAIRLDSHQWFAWLDATTTTTFSYALYNPARGYIQGFMTVRKERRRRGGAYWTVYRRQGQRLHKVYVGSSSALSLARLQEIAAALDAPRPP